MLFCKVNMDVINVSRLDDAVREAIRRVLANATAGGCSSAAVTSEDYTSVAAANPGSEAANPSGGVRRVTFELGICPGGKEGTAARVRFEASCTATQVRMRTNGTRDTAWEIYNAEADPSTPEKNTRAGSTVLMAWWSWVIIAVGALLLLLIFCVWRCCFRAATAVAPITRAPKTSTSVNTEFSVHDGVFTFPVHLSPPRPMTDPPRYESPGINLAYSVSAEHRGALGPSPRLPFISPRNNRVTPAPSYESLSPRSAGRAAALHRSPRPLLSPRGDARLPMSTPVPGRQLSAGLLPPLRRPPSAMSANSPGR